MNPCTYLLPIRRAVFDRVEADGLRSYLVSIRDAAAEIIVVDGSPDDVFEAHDGLWSEVCHHARVDRCFGFINDKVNGIHTGVRLATNDTIILADDDIRYTSGDIIEINKLLEDFDVVRPQNYFALGGHRSQENFGPGVEGTIRAISSRMEAARMLINRATLRTADYPGTCAFKRNLLLSEDKGYDGDVLFDNEELIRYFAKSGANILYANNFFVGKRPPTFRKWVEQRPRQAYEDFGLRAKTALFTALPLILITCGIRFGIRTMLLLLLGMLSAAIAIAITGWSRGTARRFFPFHITLFAPLWVIERSVSTYWAFYWFVRHGGYPFGGKLLQRGIGRDWVEGGKIASQSVARVQSRQ